MTESSGERAERYRKIAQEARALARRSEEPKLTAAYIDLADTWDRMAREVGDDDLKAPSPRGGRARPR